MSTRHVSHIWCHRTGKQPSQAERLCKKLFRVLYVLERFHIKVLRLITCCCPRPKASVKEGARNYKHAGIRMVFSDETCVRLEDLSNPLPTGSEVQKTFHVRLANGYTAREEGNKGCHSSSDQPTANAPKRGRCYVFQNGMENN